MSKRPDFIVYWPRTVWQFGVTITISGPTEADLKTLKKYLKIILVLSRHFILEKEIIFVERRQYEELKSQKTNRSKGNFSDFLDTKLSMQKFIKKEFISYGKIKLVHSIIENYSDLNLIYSSK